MGEKMTLTLLSFYLDDGGWHTEAENVRNGVDLESYENEIRLIAWLNRHLTPPAQAVDVGAIRDVIADMENTIEVWPTDLTRWNKLLTTALPNANGKEG